MFWVSLVLLLFPPVAFYFASASSAGAADSRFAPLVTAIMVIFIQGGLLAIGGWLAVTLAVVVFLAALVAVAPNTASPKRESASIAPVAAAEPAAVPDKEDDPLARWREMSPPPVLSGGYIAAIEFDYVDSQGKKSHRSVDVTAVDHEYFEGFCHKAMATRTFVTGRVRGKILIRDTGELLPPKKWAAQTRRDPHNGEITMGGDTKSETKRYDFDPDDVPVGIIGAEILFTGFAKARREELEELAECASMIVRKSVTRGLDYLVAGPNAGPTKLDQAAAVGASIIDADGFLDLVA